MMGFPIMKLKRIFIILFATLFLIQFSSAKLEITSDDNFTIVGEVGEVLQLTLELQNTGTQTYNNISFEDNEYVTFESIDSLSAGEVTTVNFEVTIGNKVTKDILIQGTYVENIGTSDDEYIFNVVNEDEAGIPEEYRNMNVYIGDTLKIINEVSDWIELYDVKNSQQIRKINEGENYTKHFDTPEEIRYVIRRRGVLDLTSIFTLNVLPTSGNVHNPLSDAVLHLIINPTYEPTVLSPTFINTDFEMEFYETGESAFVLKNIDDETAYVSLEGEWMTFSKNDFTIEPNQTVSVTFTIDLNSDELSDFDDSDMTNKTYTKYLRIVGNFPTISKPINVFIEYTEIVDGEIPEDFTEDLLDNLVKEIELYCENFPESSLCKQAYYTGGNSGEEIIEFNASRYSFQEVLSATYDTKDTIEEGFSLYGDQLQDFEARINDIESSDDTLNDKVLTQLEDVRDNNNVLMTIIIAFILTFVVVILVYATMEHFKIIKNKKINRGQFN